MCEREAIQQSIWPTFLCSVTQKIKEGHSPAISLHPVAPRPISRKREEKEQSSAPGGKEKLSSVASVFMQCSVQGQCSSGQGSAAQRRAGQGGRWPKAEFYLRDKIEIMDRVCGCFLCLLRDRWRLPDSRYFCCCCFQPQQPPFREQIPIVIAQWAPLLRVVGCRSVMLCPLGRRGMQPCTELEKE